MEGGDNHPYPLNIYKWGKAIPPRWNLKYEWGEAIASQTLTPPIPIQQTWMQRGNYLPRHFLCMDRGRNYLPTRLHLTYGWKESTEGCLCYITQPDEVRIKSVNLETKLLITVILQHLLPTIFVSMVSVEGNHTEVLTNSTMKKYRKHNTT